MQLECLKFLYRSFCFCLVQVLELVVAKPHTVVGLRMTVIESPRACDFHAFFWIHESLCRLL